MKTERVFLCEWLGDYADGYNDIPWPMVHEQVGYDAIRWIKCHPWEQVQLILEKPTAPMAAGMQRLYAEFYVPALRSEFALRFAK